MFRSMCKHLIMALAVGSSFLMLPLNKAQAVPSYARQTGMPCNTCHTVYPELTPAEEPVTGSRNGQPDSDGVYPEGGLSTLGLHQDFHSIHHLQQV